MRVGKTNIVTCDHCEERVEGEFSSLTRSGLTKYFCPGCMDEYLKEQFNEYIEGEVRRRTQPELNFVFRNTCPSCKARLRAKMDPSDEIPDCPECGARLSCPNCGWES